MLISQTWLKIRAFGEEDGERKMLLIYYVMKMVKENEVKFVDFRSVPIGTLPDGRTRYGPFPGTNNNTNTDIVLTNGDKGRSHVGVVRVDKSFDWGLNLSFAYSLQDVKDETPATSSTPDVPPCGSELIPRRS